MKLPYPRDGSALDCALEIIEREAPEQTRRARRALDVLLNNVRTSCWPEVAWFFSTLTPDGFPIELTFSSVPGYTLRYALEIAGPEMPEQQRLAEAFRLYEKLAGRSASMEVAREMLGLQSGRELFYGAWFGGAHTKTTDRYKIYAEVPKQSCVEKFLPRICLGELPLRHCHSRPVMLGYQPDSGMREIYFRAANPEPADIGKLLWNNNLGHRYQETLELIEATAGRPGATAALEGFSLAFNSSSRTEAVSLFAEAELLFGSDANMRCSLVKIARARSWPLGGFEQVTQIIEERDDTVRNSGVIAWIISADNPVELRVSVRPPEIDGTWPQASA